MDPTETSLKVTSKDTGQTVVLKFPTPPPMRVVTKGWFGMTEELVPLAELKRRNAHD